jgi:crossover junction endodeoxyribonuclease RusA
LPLLEFVVIGTPVSSQGSSDNRRFWQQLVQQEGRKAATVQLPVWTAVVLRLAYFHVDDPIADLDNIVKPVQDALKGIAYADDNQVIDLIASMRRKVFDTNIPMTAALARGFDGESDFIHVVVDQSSRIEAFQ